ncbi:hypothetical protein [Bradyrhizobium sp. CCBAU 11357]|uniref:hypothetical protein n=1 Tax=Bradyrhizobium sp. CCBAU 11357 TaxID=1630808 RepID=UPI0023024624|nr:hypothetical protein [Bradyrhizobium sp. CCBAU 11357]MDA9497252.1 hypothetical protein [Bradyrhizobium sp. CCBAU 11357]
MATADLEWLAEQIQLKFQRMHAKAERDRELVRRSFEAIAKAKQLLSEPAPKVWSGRRKQDRLS